MQARLLRQQKIIIQDRYIVELIVHEVGVTNAYPDGLKYGLIFFDLKTKKKILMDNHSPKGHHFHINEEEFVYEFDNLEKLLEDFKKLVFDFAGIKL